MKKILIIGAGFLQRFVIQKAVEMGYWVAAADGNNQAVGFADAHAHYVVDIKDKAACLDCAKRRKIDGVLTAATDYGVETAAYIADNLGLPGLSCKAAQTVKNKFRVRQILCEAGADEAEPSVEVRDEDTAESVKDWLSYPVMVKPCDGSGSRAVVKVSEPSALWPACRTAIESSISRKAVIEPFADGTEYGVELLVHEGVPHVLAVIKKWMTSPPYYAELGHAIPSGLPDEVERRVAAAAEKAVLALGIMTGAVNMDVLVTAQGAVHIVDVGARMGGNLIGSHIIPMGTGYNYMGNLIRAAAGDPVSLPRGGGRPVATRLLALTPGTVAQLPDFEELAGRFDVRIYHHLRVNGAIPLYRTNLDGCGYVVAFGGTPKETSGRAERALRAIDAAIQRT